MLIAFVATEIDVAILAQNISQECQRAYDPEQQYCPTRYVTLVWLNKFLVTYKDAIPGAAAIIGAAATFLIAVFTFQLWRTSRGQFKALSDSVIAAQKTAKAAGQTASAAVAVEQARFHVVIERAHLISILKASRMFPHSPDDSFVETGHPVRFHFKNFGKTPGVIHEAFKGKIEYAQEPPVPVYTAISRQLSTHMIASGDETVRQEAKFPPLTHGQAKLIDEGLLSIWFYGKLIYKDVFGNEHCHRFYWCFNGKRPFGPYDYKHYNESF